MISGVFSNPMNLILSYPSAQFSVSCTMGTREGDSGPQEGMTLSLECEIQAAQMRNALGSQTKGFDFKCKPAQ